MKVAADVLAAIEAHAREADPHECCGLLLGTADLIATAMPAANRSTDPERRYEIDPHDHFGAIREARARGLAVVGAYHSHPRSEPIPSKTDRAEAFEHFVFVIVGRSEDRPLRPEATCDVPGLARWRLDQPIAPDRFTIRAWRFSSGNFAELPLVCDP